MSNNISKTGQTTELTAKIGKMDLTKADLKKEADALFTKSYFNGGQDSIDDINAQIKKIDEQIEAWQAKIDTLQQKVDDIEKKIDTKSGELSDAIFDLNEETRKYEADLKEAIDMAITNAIRQTKVKNASGSKTTSFETEFQTQLDNLAPNFEQITAIYSKQNGLSSELQSYCTQLDGVITESNAAANGLKNAQAVVTLLTQTKNNMSAEVDSLYANSNKDSKAPVYTYEKEAVVADLADKYGTNLAGRGNATETVNSNGTGTKNQAAIDGYMAQLKEMGKASAGTGDTYKADNPGNELSKNLAKVLFGEGANAATATTVQKDSLVYKMAEAGMSNIEIMDAIASNFGGIHVGGSNGEYSIPYGHDTESKRIYGALKSVANNTSGIPEVKPPAADATMAKNATEAVKTLASKGFTFKEAMFALDQLFPGLDIGYSLGEQVGTKEGVVRFTSDKSYDTLANTIEGLTKNGQVWQDSKVIRSTPVENKPADVKRTDPISIKTKDANGKLTSSIYFMADNGNGKYDGVTDLLGSENGMKDFDTKYKDYITTNANGEKVITGDALDSIMVMVVEENDKADSKGNGGVGVKQSFMSAKDAGITEINLSSAQKNGKYDINGGEIQNTFNVKMGGTTLTAEQAMEDEEYLAATLNNDKLTGENLFSQLTQAQVDKAFSDASGKYSGDIGKLQNIAAKAAELKNKLTGGNGGTETEAPTETETDFRKRVTEEMEYAKLIAKRKGDELYDEMEADFSDSRDPSGFDYIYNSGKILNEEIQKGVTEEIQKKYDTYGKNK